MYTIYFGGRAGERDRRLWAVSGVSCLDTLVCGLVHVVELSGALMARGGARYLCPLPAASFELPPQRLVEQLAAVHQVRGGRQQRHSTQI